MTAQDADTVVVTDLVTEIVRRWITAGDNASLDVLARMAVAVVLEQFEERS